MPSTVRTTSSLRLLPVPTLMVLASSMAFAEDKAPSTEVIQVNATKQAEEQHRLPASVTPITREQLDQRGAHSLAEEWQLTPNVTQFTDKPNGALSVRGVGSSEQPRFGGEENPTRGRSPAVVLYVDGAPVDAERGLAAFDDPLDLERVELLRGPQGTLYGRNALGGVVALTSRDPGRQAELDGRAFYGTDNQLRASAAGGGPLGDIAGLRLAGGYSQSDGSLKNITTGDDQTAAWNRIQARGKILLHASDALDLRLTVGGSKYNGSTDVWVPFATRDDRETVTNAPHDDTVTGMTSALQADWYLDKATTLTAVLGVSQAKEEVEYDSDRSAFDLGRTKGSNDASTGSVEIRLAHQDEGPLEWLVGVFAARDRVKYDTNTQFSDTLIPTQQFGPLPYYLLIQQPEHYHKESENTGDSIALFAEGTWDMTEHWALTLGLRLGYESSDLDWHQQQHSTFPNQAAPDGSFSWSGDRDDTVVLPKAALAYHVDTDRMAYGSVTRGYRAGGLNSTATSLASAQLEYDPEYTWNYELGWRSLWAERAVAFNVTGFYIDWRDQQVFTERAPYDVVPTNASKSHVLGAEAELRWRSATGLSLWANGGIMQAEFDDRTGQEFQQTGQNTFVTNTVEYDGNRFAHIPEWTWALGSAYIHASGVFIRADFHGHSWTYADDKNEHQADGVALIDARIGYADKWWSVALAGLNLTDETDILTSITLPGDQIFTTSDTSYVRLAPGRTLGVEVSAWW
ncbi:MAG TPA: TonB-dependent receptor [Planctomycetota bacterium]|nr:TonB-dependent receptor [Planctomycetota bacterium]